MLKETLVVPIVYPNWIYDLRIDLINDAKRELFLFWYKKEFLFVDFDNTIGNWYLDDKYNAIENVKNDSYYYGMKPLHYNYLFAKGLREIYKDKFCLLTSLPNEACARARIYQRDCWFDKHTRLIVCLPAKDRRIEIIDTYTVFVYGFESKIKAVQALACDGILFDDCKSNVESWNLSSSKLAIQVQTHKEIYSLAELKEAKIELNIGFVLMNAMFNGIPYDMLIGEDQSKLRDAYAGLSLAYKQYLVNKNRWRI